MKLYFTRHGQTDWNVLGRIQGSADTDINETGIKQAMELAEHIKKDQLHLDCVYSSPQRRAFHTAKIISDTIDKEIHVMPGLEEINLGEWEGNTWDEVKENYPNEYKEWYENRRYTKAPGGESYDEMITRVLDSIEKIKRCGLKDILIVTHGAVLMCLQCYLNDVPFHKMRMFHIDNAKILELDL